MRVFDTFERMSLRPSHAEFAPLLAGLALGCFLPKDRVPSVPSCSAALRQSTSGERAGLEGLAGDFVDEVDHALALVALQFVAVGA